MLTIITPSASEALVTVDRVKNELSLTGEDVDARIEDLIEEASSLLAAYCNRDGFGAEDVRQTERISRGAERIFLERNVEPEITLITVGDAELAPTDYEVDGSFLYRLSGDARICWAAGKVVIDYSAGFELPGEAPVALSRAALDLVVGMYRGTGRDTGVRSEQVEGVGQTTYFDTKAGQIPLSADRVAALARYRLVGIG